MTRLKPMMNGNPRLAGLLDKWTLARHRSKNIHHRCQMCKICHHTIDPTVARGKDPQLQLKACDVSERDYTAIGPRC